MTPSDEPLAIPLWIDGHAYLTLAADFADVCSPVNGAVLRRTPLCGVREARMAVASARRALAGWQGYDAAGRSRLLAALADALLGHASHFAALIGEESGADGALAAAEVDAAVLCLRGAPAGDPGDVVAISGSRKAPLLSSLRCAVPALRAGSTVVVRPSPQAPAAVFALAELTRRSGFPAGVFNVVHGGAAMSDALRTCGAPLYSAAADDIT